MHFLMSYQLKQVPLIIMLVQKNKGGNWHANPQISSTDC